MSKCLTLPVERHIKALMLQKSPLHAAPNCCPSFKACVKKDTGLAVFSNGFGDSLQTHVKIQNAREARWIGLPAFKQQKCFVNYLLRLSDCFKSVLSF